MKSVSSNFRSSPTTTTIYKEYVTLFREDEILFCSGRVTLPNFRQSDTFTHRKSTRGPSHCASLKLSRTVWVSKLYEYRICSLRGAVFIPGKRDCLHPLLFFDLLSTWSDPLLKIRYKLGSRLVSYNYLILDKSDGRSP